MPILDRKKLEEAFKRAAWMAVHGTREERSGIHSIWQVRVSSRKSPGAKTSLTDARHSLAVQPKRLRAARAAARSAREGRPSHFFRSYEHLLEIT